jgi:hypothetical protein
MSMSSSDLPCASRRGSCIRGCFLMAPFACCRIASFELGPTTVPERVRPGREPAGPAIVEAREVSVEPLMPAAGCAKSDARMVPARFLLCLMALDVLRLMPTGLSRERVRIGSWVPSSRLSVYTKKRFSIGQTQINRRSHLRMNHENQSTQGGRSMKELMSTISQSGREV